MAAVIANLAAGVSGVPARPRCWPAPAGTSAICVIVATADRGLAGGFNSAIVRAAREHIAALIAEGKDVRILTSAARAATSCAASTASTIVDSYRRSASSASASRAPPTSARKRAGHVRRRRGRRRDAGLRASSRSITQTPTAQQLIPAPVEAEHADAMRRRSTNTSPTKARSSPRCCRATSRCRSSARCWRTRPASSLADDRDGQRHPQRRRHDRRPHHAI